MGLFPESGRSPGGGHGNPFQFSCLENPMDRGAWRATFLGLQRVGHDRSNLADTHSLATVVFKQYVKTKKENSPPSMRVC